MLHVSNLSNAFTPRRVEVTANASFAANSNTQSATANRSPCRQAVNTRCAACTKGVSASVKVNPLLSVKYQSNSFFAVVLSNITLSEICTAHINTSKPLGLQSKGENFWEISQNYHVRVRHRRTNVKVKSKSQNRYFPFVKNQNILMLVWSKARETFFCNRYLFIYFLGFAFPFSREKATKTSLPIIFSFTGRLFKTIGACLQQ